MDFSSESSRKPRRALWRDDAETDHAAPPEVVEFTVSAPHSSLPIPSSPPRDDLLPPAAVPIRRDIAPVKLSPRASSQERVSLGEALHNAERGHKFYWRWADEQLLRKTLLKAAAVQSQQKDARDAFTRVGRDVSSLTASLNQLNEALSVPGQSPASRIALQQRKMKVVQNLSVAEETMLALEQQWGAGQPLALDADDVRILRGARAMCGGRLWPLPETVLSSTPSLVPRPGSAGMAPLRARSPSSARGRRPFFARFVASLGHVEAERVLRAADSALDAVTPGYVPKAADARRSASPQTTQRWVDVEERLQVPLTESGVFSRFAPHADSQGRQGDSFATQSGYSTVVNLKGRGGGGAPGAPPRGNLRPSTAVGGGGKAKPRTLQPVSRQGAASARPVTASATAAVAAELERAMAQSKAADGRGGVRPRTSRLASSAPVGSAAAAASASRGASGRSSRRSSVVETPAAGGGGGKGAAANRSAVDPAAVQQEWLRRMQAHVSRVEQTSAEQASEIERLQQRSDALAAQLARQTEAFNTLRTQTDRAPSPSPAPEDDGIEVRFVNTRRARRRSNSGARARRRSRRSGSR